MSVDALQLARASVVDDTKVVEKDCSPQLDAHAVVPAQEARLASPDQFPDGGLRAWLVVCGALCNNLATFGFVNSWGVFQAYYEQTLLKDSSASDIAWIGSIQYSLIFFPGLFTGRMFDLGYFKIPYFIATLLLVVAVILSGECKHYWQFVLCQGVLVGLCCGALFGPTSGVIPHWFKLRKGLAFGIIAIGSSIGGTVFPIAARNLIPLVGFNWTMRILGLIILACLGVANVTMRRRLPPKRVKGGFFHLRAFKSAPYSVFCLAGFLTFLGLYTVLTYIDVSSVSVGIPADFSFYLIAIANASSAVGRVIAGTLSDKAGAMNVMVPLTTVAAVMTYAWPFARTKGAIVVVAVIYGFASGAFIGSFTVPLVELGETEDVGRRIGMAMTLLAFGALAGPPISGAIGSATGGYAAVGYYAGSIILLSVVCMCWTRHLVLKRPWGKF